MIEILESKLKELKETLANMKQQEQEESEFNSMNVLQMQAYILGFHASTELVYSSLLEAKIKCEENHDA